MFLVPRTSGQNEWLLVAICRYLAIKIRWIMRLPVGRVVRSTNMQISLMPVPSLM
jgi:hypothetical protein